MLLERRRYKRIPAFVPVEYRGKTIWQVVEAHNISEGGTFISTDKIEAPESLAELIFNFGEEGQNFVYTQGKVVWNREKPLSNSEGKIVPAGMGVQFTKFLSLEYKKFISDKVRTHR